ncbi:pentapeptide repeat-containing protein [Roseibium album]|uniref:anti-phage Hailong system effector protein HalA n=1 Tax=Roseibium album TaxID=311410 RepID=UPI00329A66A6
MSEDEIVIGGVVPVRSRRKNNWWEPMYSPEDQTDFRVGDWDFSNNKGPCRFLFRAEDLDEPLKRITEVKFEDCDFQGKFQVQLIFKDCKFERCDFGLCTFYRAKFTNCEFICTSFSQCELSNCEFRDCKYSEISFSGNETQLPRTLITDPDKFIFGGKAALRNLPADKSGLVQRLRFEETRSTLSRSILANLQSEGSEDTFYSAVQTASICEDRARFAKGVLRIYQSVIPSLKPDLHLLSRFWNVFVGITECVSAVLSLMILRVMGWLNGWGGNITRVLLVGAALIISIAYRMSYKYSLPYGQSLIKTTEVFLLFGYTNHAKFAAQDFSLIFGTALCGLFWYALAIPTVVNRLTRARG